jgi:hypothetical protein
MTAQLSGQFFNIFMAGLFRLEMLLMQATF